MLLISIVTTGWRRRIDGVYDDDGECKGEGDGWEEGEKKTTKQLSLLSCSRKCIWEQGNERENKMNCMYDMIRYDTYNEYSNGLDSSNNSCWKDYDTSDDDDDINSDDAYHTMQSNTCNKNILYTYV